MAQPPLTILMCTYQGVDHLPAQLRSFLDQSHRNWRLFVSDDGSSDGTREMLATWGARNPDAELRLVDGPGAGQSAANFLSLLARTTPEDGYLAFADQDDVWLPQKLERACAKIAALPDPEAPAVYSSRSLHLLPGRARPVPSRRFGRPPAFGNALVQNILSGHALVMNPAAACILRASVPAALSARVPYHDWWFYQIATGAGMQVVIDDEPMLLYRQHDANELGGNRGFGSGLARIGMLWSERFAGWIDRNLEGLAACDDLLNPEAREMRDAFAAWRRSGRNRLLRGPHALGLYRQSRGAGVALELMGRLGRI
ncbi:glycosyltransferase [Pseudothioclava nitratireducens]|uniref:glycosyltransferase n=1 Tax=Pseudothioclava nitratireducens TaxID=1928646 RepID=UPI0023DC8BD2|nr:glycosyltransferase [Defluviimonas nitratireducens]MDF1619982.1 glycosyltransferase [Defluviimonas nitratireducens]